MSVVIFLFAVAGVLIVDYQTRQAMAREQLLDTFCRIECKDYINNVKLF